MTGIAFNIGTFAVHWYGILISLGVISALTIAYIETKRRGENPDHLINMALIVIPLGVIGSRIYHVIDRWEYFMRYPGEIIGFQGLGIFGAVIGGALGAVIYTQWKKLATLRWLDILAPGVILAQAIGRWGNYFNQELFGYPSQLPWAVYIEPSYRLPGFTSFETFHPLFLYESILNLFGFGILMITGRKLYSRLRDGDILFLYVIYYGIVRFILEGFKPEVWTLGGVPTARWLTGIAVLVATALLILRHYKKPVRMEENS